MRPALPGDMVRRRLGGWETMTCIMHESYPGTGIFIGRVCVRGSVEIEALRRALEVVEREQPLLRSQLVDAVTSPRLVLRDTPSPIPLDVVTDADPLATNRIMREHMSQPFERGGDRLWRAVWRQDRGGGELFFVSHHTICDGVSVVALLRRVLQVLADPPSELPARVTELPASIEARIGGAPGAWAYFFRHLVRGLPRVLGSRQRIAMDGYAAYADRRTEHVFRHLELDETEALLARARENGTTVHAALIAAQARAMRSWMPGPDYRIVMSNAFNCRKLLPPAPADQPPTLACCVSVPDALLDVRSSEEFWSLARRAKERVTRSIEDVGRVPADLPFRFTKRVIETGVDESDRSRRFINNLSTTNLGRVQMEPRIGALDVIGLSISAARRVGDFPVMLHALTLHGSLRLTFTYESPLCSEARARTFVTDVLSELRTVISG